MRLFFMFTHFFSAAILVRFAISKLFAWPISVAAFIEMAEPIGINPTFFRIFTGLTLTVVIAGYLVSLFLVSQNNFPKNKESLIFVGAANLLGAGVMTGALISEFFLRSAPKWPLVYIASAIIVFSIMKLNRLRGMRVSTAITPSGVSSLQTQPA